MTDNANEVTVDNSVLILIEGLASSAKALNVPVILTTVTDESRRRRLSGQDPDRSNVDERLG